MNQPTTARTGTAPARQPRLVMCHKLREAFSPEECARVIEAGKSFEVIHGVIGAKGKVDSNYRESQIAWLENRRNELDLRPHFRPRRPGQPRVLALRYRQRRGIAVRHLRCRRTLRLASRSRR